ncbi:MAG TPA: hypothetical protein VM689_20845 [Aliidongia sp.]|nr:hypothetical protein [Aliidongia sp.]
MRPRSNLGARVASGPTTEEEIDRQRAAAWHRQGVVLLRPDEIEPSDPWFAQAIRNYANRHWGRRS